jgi:hypothetical protein
MAVVVLVALAAMAAAVVMHLLVVQLLATVK